MASENNNYSTSELQSIFFAKMDTLVGKFGPRFIIALSGGGDSLALTKLCAEYQKQKKCADLAFRAVIIDHGIAKGSYLVASNAAAIAKAIGIDAEILPIPTKITKSIQESARIHRYELLRRAASLFGAKTIILGHNYDDQIETILFRMSRKTGIDGVSGMRPEQISHDRILVENTVLARPLLFASRNDLRRVLHEAAIKHYDDPANENFNFSRVKIRGILARIRSMGLDERKLTKIGATALRLREMQEKQALDFLSENLKIDKLEGKISINLGAEESFFHRTAIGAIIQALCGKTYLEIGKVESLLARIFEPRFKGATLANLQIKRKKGELVFSAAPKRKNADNNPSIDFDKITIALNAYLNNPSFI